MALMWPPPGTVPLPIDVVSVQSQVVYGRVGNNVAVPTLSTFGLSVAAVPTVAFSNTPHYATLHGGAVPVEWFEGWLDDLVARGGLRGLRAVLTGYLGSAAQARVLARWIGQRLAEHTGVRVVVDPVIGDHQQGVYVDPALVDAYRHDLLALADGLTPNDFELAHLTGRDITDVAATVAAARTLIAGRTQWVAVTSAAPATWSALAMRLVLVTRDTARVITHPRLDVEPKGTGDLFASTLTGCWLRGDTLPAAIACACQRVIDALRITRDARCAELLLPASKLESRGHPDVSIHDIGAVTRQ